MKVSLRTIQKPFVDMIKGTPEYTQEYYRPTHLLRKMVANEDEFYRFKAYQKKADLSDVRFNIMFPEETPDQISLTVAERTNPTSRDLATVISNMFTTKGNREKLPTMTTKECLDFFKNAFLGAFRPNRTPNYPTRNVTFNPSEPYADKINNALREFANERYI